MELCLADFSWHWSSQGSIFGPLLFSNHIDDISDVRLSSSSLCLLYADDRLIDIPASCSNGFLALQIVLNMLKKQSDKQLLQLNSTK